MVQSSVGFRQRFPSFLDPSPDSIRGYTMQFTQFYGGYMILHTFADYFIFLVRRQILGENRPKGRIIKVSYNPTFDRW